MYRQYLSKEEYDDIVHSDRDDPDIPPHCDPTMFHEPGICAFCDGYFRRHPSFKPATYVTPEANGWGGNQAPIVDDTKASEEQAQWDQWVEEMISGEYEANERKRLALTVEHILSIFRRKK